MFKKHRHLQQVLHALKNKYPICSKPYVLVFSMLLCLPKAKKGARCFLDASDLPPDDDDQEERTAENYGVDGRHFHEERSARFSLNMLFFCCSVHFGCFFSLTTAFIQLMKTAKQVL